MHVLVAGGGIGGLTAALCLAKRGFDVTVLEQSSAIGEIGTGIQLSPNATRVLFHLGLEDALRSVSFSPEASEMRQWRTGVLIARSPLGETATQTYGFPYFHIHRGDFITVLEEAVRASPSIRLHTSARVSAQQDEGPRVTVESAAGAFTADVLIGADGIRSVVRTAVAGPEKPEFTGNIAWRVLVPAAALPAGQVRPVTTAWWGPGAHVVHYYLRRGELVNCVFIREQRGWEVESWTEPGDPQELAAAFAGWHPEIGALISHARRDTLFKWALFDRPPMTSWGTGRVTLLGDACHATLPFMAQGAAMAIEDAVVLAACLQNADGAPQALKRYAELRKTRTAWIQAGSRRNAEVFHMRGIKAWVRNRAAGRAVGDRLRAVYAYDALQAAGQ
ncbi:MAG: FAD-binding protein [Gammaproteobacteria bacterium]|nr:FAD-binding protein [Gammaproteobacteria bacterium]